MMDDSRKNEQVERWGLCATCVHRRVIRNDRGSEFVRCGLAATDPRFAKYPRLPMRACDGWRDKLS